MNRELNQEKIYDEVAAKVESGHLLRLENFAPPFVVVRVIGIQKVDKGDGKFEHVMSVQAEPWSMPVQMGKAHKGIIRVVDVEAEEEAERRVKAVLSGKVPAPIR